MTLRDYVLIVARSWIVVAVTVAVASSRPHRGFHDHHHVHVVGPGALHRARVYQRPGPRVCRQLRPVADADVQELGTSTSLMKTVAERWARRGPRRAGRSYRDRGHQLNTVATVSATDTTAKGAAHTANTVAGPARRRPEVEADEPPGPERRRKRRQVTVERGHHRPGRRPDVAVRPGRPALPPRRSVRRPRSEHRRRRAPGGAEGRGLVVPRRGSLMVVAPASAGSPRWPEATPAPLPRTCAARCTPRDGCTPPRH